MNKIKYFVLKLCLKFIYSSLIHSHLNYGVLLWGFDSKKIITLQKKALRVVTNSHFLAHTASLFKVEKVLKVDDIFKVHCFKLYYQYMNCLLPQSIQSFFITRDTNEDSNELELFNCNDINGKKRIRYHLPQLINSTPSNIKNKAVTHYLESYKKYAKNSILQDYDDTPCQIPNCYSCRTSNRIT